MKPMKPQAIHEEAQESNDEGLRKPRSSVGLIAHTLLDTHLAKMSFYRDKMRELARKKMRWPARKPCSSAGLTVYMLLLALLIGFTSAYWMVRDPYPLGRQKIGAWVYWPDVGSANIDPYALAIVNRTARLPLTVSEGLELVATHDMSGATLSSSCIYTIGPTAPQARFWTLAAYNGADGSLIRTDLGRAGFTSNEIVRHEDGTFTIIVSRHVQAGNWLQLPDEKNVLIVMRLYDVPATGDGIMIDPARMPRIERVECMPS